MKLLNKNISNMSVSAMRCDGTFNVTLEYGPKIEDYIELFCLNVKSVAMLDGWLRNKDNQFINIDDRLLTRTNEQ